MFHIAWNWSHQEDNNILAKEQILIYQHKQNGSLAEYIYL